MQILYFLFITSSSERKLLRESSWELLRSKPYCGERQDELRRLRSLLGAARVLSFFSSSLPSLLSSSISLSIFFLSPSSFSFSFSLSLFPLGSFFLYAVPHLHPSFAFPFSSHPLKLGLIVPPGNGCPTYMYACVPNARECVRL